MDVAESEKNILLYVNDEQRVEIITRVAVSRSNVCDECEWGPEKLSNYHIGMLDEPKSSFFTPVDISFTEQQAKAELCIHS